MGNHVLGEEHENNQSFSREEHAGKFYMFFQKNNENKKYIIFFLKSEFIILIKKSKSKFVIF